MWPVVELLVLSWIAVGGWWLWRRGPAGCASAALGLAIAYVAAFAVVWPVDRVLAGLAVNLWLRLASAGLAGTLVFLVVARRWRPWGERLRLRWAGSWDGTWRGRVVVAATLGLWLAGHLLAWVLMANLLATAFPELGGSMRSSSLISGRLLGTAPGGDWEQQFADQQRRLGGLTGGVDRVLEATGARRLMEVMDAVAWIAGLDSAEHARLVAENPELRRLATEPAMLAVVDDPRLMRLVDEAMRGSLPAAYALGAEPAVLALIDSPGMREAIRAVDPVALRHRAASAAGDDGLVWELGGLDSSLGLDERLAATEGWTGKRGGGFLAWDGTARFGVARTHLPAAPAVRRLGITTTAPFSCWFAGRLLRPEGRSPSRVVVLPAEAGELVVLLDFAGIPAPHLCSIR